MAPDDNNKYCKKPVSGVTKKSATPKIPFNKSSFSIKQSLSSSANNSDPCSLTIESEFLTTFEAAEYLRVSVGSLRNMTSNGQVPFHKLGNRNRYLKEDLRKLLLSNRRGGFHGN
tara:strand:- start:1260 stop:1604 length:345 start_codon:yes stop_codon:yes gene_type:complete